MTAVVDWGAHGRTLRSVVDRMIPADDFPSGWAAGVGEFIGRIVETDLADRRDWLASGLAALDVEAAARSGGLAFADLPSSAQDSLLTSLARGSTASEWPLSAPEFIDRLAALCAQGFYGDPGNGGNHRRAGWRMIGYRELPQGKKWPEAEQAPGPVTGWNELKDRYDAIIVGAGAGGNVAACVLAEAGLSVLLVERADSLSSDQLPLDHLRSERSGTGYPSRTGPDRQDARVVVDSTGARTVFAPDPSWSANAMTVGGGTRVYGAQAWRFCPEDFRMASIYGVPEGSSLADWPIGYEDLEPWYDQAEWELGVAGDSAGNRFAGPRTRGYPMAPMERNLGGDVLAAAAERLGLSTSAVPLAINTTPHGGRPACVRCGACVGFACHAGAKNGTYNTVLPRALATGRCDLLVGAQATRVLVDAEGRADGVALATETTTGIVRRVVRADNIVLAAGAIETARLLLNSATDLEPNGLGNSRDQVGRNLQAHVYAGAIGLFDDIVQDSSGPGPCIATNDFRHHNPGIVGGGMLANDFVPTPLNVWETLSRLQVIDRFGYASKQGMRRLWSRMQMVFGPVQEVPNAESRVEVDAEVRDRFGTPVARLSGDIHPEDRRAAGFLADKAADWLVAGGAHDVIRMAADDRPEGPSGGQHQAGTCRMGDDPAVSVTDAWGRVWGHENVLIADGSVHVTNGGVNPVLTIVALAYRNSSRLGEQWKTGSSRQAASR